MELSIMLLNIITIIFSFFFIVLANADDRPIVNTPLGTVRGIHKKSYDGRIFSSFEGIPYAKPPVGKLRFEKPVETEGWKGTWEASRVYECPQVYFLSPQKAVFGSEDCLYINVYVPREIPSKNDNFDVIVHIHGGAFMLGSGHNVKPTFLMDRDVIFVTFNYRVGIFGFLSTEDDVLPGNNGLKDQTLALKWIQKNIKSFGGNPNSVTLTGLSAGAASVHFHYLSPLSKNLFHRGIAESGVTLNPWTIQENALEKAQKLGSSLGCNYADTKDLIKCLKERPATAILEKTTLFLDFDYFPFAPFAPVVEKSTKGAFLAESPYKLLKDGNVNKAPLIISITSEEGIFPGALLATNLKDVDQNWIKLAPSLLDYNYTVSESEKLKIADEIKKFYFKGENLSEKNIQQLIKMLTDRHFAVGAEMVAKLQSKYADIYFYVFGYRGEHSLSTFFTGSKDVNYGVCHGDDAIYLYDLMLTHPLKFSKEDEQMKEVFMDMYASYAKTGKPEVPNVKWDPISDKFSLLKIKGPNNLNVEKVEGISEANFWNSLPINENEKVFSTKDEL